jgi:enoyl-CoA hydratase/carnithine racemase
MTNLEALTQALVLAVTAPSDDKAKQAVQLAERIAANMSEIEVAQAKRDAEAHLENIL